MGFLRALGLHKDPHVEWMIEAYGATPREQVVNRLYQGSPRFERWQGETDGVPLTFYTPAGKRQGAGVVYLAKAGPQFMDGNEYRCCFYRPRKPPSLSIDNPRWARAVEKATDDPDWTSSFPEDAFELGVAVGSFALELDGPLDPRPAFAYLETLRRPLDAMSDAVDGVLLYPSGLAVGFEVERLTKEKLVSDVGLGLSILRLNSPAG